MPFPRPAVATRTRTAAPGFSQTAPGQIVPYQAPGGAVPQQPTRLNPEPYRPTSTPQPMTAQRQNNDVIDAEIVPQTRQNPRTNQPQPQRRTVQSDGNKSGPVVNPQYFPQYAPVDSGFNTVAEFDAWQNGVSRDTLAKEAAAYKEAKNFPNAGGIISLIPGAWERVNLPLGEWQDANKYAKRHGLPALDRHGNEQAPAAHPDTAPARDFQSNPFKQPAPKQSPFTPFTPTDNPYNFDNDPETGLPYTESQQRGGEQTGRPPWHINPETGRPWNDPLDNPGTPIPLPFNGAPGGGLRFPSPVNSGPITGTWNLMISATYSGGQESVRLPRTYKGFSTDVFAGTSNGSGIDLTKNGQVIHANWTLVGVGLNIYGGFTADPQPASPDAPEFTPIGTPTPAPTTPNLTKPQPQPQPQPAPDPRLNPTKPSPTPTNPNPKPSDHPNTPNLTKPQPQPAAKPAPQIPGQPGYNPGGNPGRNPGANPEPARPSRPSSGTGTGSSTQNPPKDPPTDICEEPCIKEMKDRQSEVTITIKIFDSCKLDSNGNPDYFKTKQIKCSKSDKEQLIEQFATLAEIQSQQCKEAIAIAAIPEAWAVRNGTDRPQLVVTYAEKFASGKLGSSRWTLTIPHFRGAAGSRPAVPSYRRGPWQGTLQLNDGATIIVNCASSSEARRTLNRLKILTDNSKRMRGGKAIQPIIKENPNSTIKEVSIIPLNVKFFASGQTDMTPTWSRSLR